MLLLHINNIGQFVIKMHYSKENDSVPYNPILKKCTLSTHFQTILGNMNISVKELPHLSHLKMYLLIQYHHRGIHRLYQIFCSTYE